MTTEGGAGAGTELEEFFASIGLPQYAAVFAKEVPTTRARALSSLPVSLSFLLCNRD
jgi:hypothetical protein